MLSFPPKRSGVISIAHKNIAVHMALCIVLVGATFAVYADTLGHSFLSNWDDSLYVVENEAIRGITWGNLKDAFTRFYIGNYAPIHIISYMLDYEAWGLNPRGFILSNVVMHAANGLLFYALLMRLHRNKALAFLAAFIFLFHPVQVESVAWISERKNLLAMFFCLASFHCHISYRTMPEPRRMRFYVCSVVAFVLAVLSKSVSVILPLVFILYDLCYLKGSRQVRWLTDKIPFLLVASATVLIALKSQLPEHEGGRISYSIEGPLGIFYTMLTVLTRYFKLIFWPRGLSAVYMPPMKVHMDASVGFSALFAAVLCAVGCFLYRKRTQFCFWYALFFTALLPVSQIVSLVTLINDRYLYFPMLGAAACYGLLAFPRDLTALDLRMRVVAAALCLIVLPLPYLSWQRTSVWSNDLSLWKDVTTKTPTSPLAWNGLGMAYIDAGRPIEAADALLKALSIDPDYELALNNLGALYNSTGKIAEARPFLLKAVELFPYKMNALLNLGINYYLSHEFEKAEQTFQKALALNPQSPQALSGLGDVYSKMNKLDMAKRYYGMAMLAGGDAAYLEYALAGVVARGGHPQEALVHLESALQMGYHDLRNIRENPALDSLRGLREFNILVHRYSAQ